jgi:hypothetical protein
MALNLAGPKTSDQKLIFQPAQFRGDVQVYWPGRADDIAAGTRHEGTRFRIQSTVAEDVAPYEFQFGEFIYFVGGTIEWQNAVFGDEVSFEVYAPATPCVSNPGAGDYNKVATGLGYNIIVPATPGTGDWDVDLTAKVSANVRFTNAAPVPGTAGASYFNWDEDTDAVTVAMSGPNPVGNFNLFDAEIVLNLFVPTMQMLGDGERALLSPSVKGKKMLPHWIYRVKLHNSTTKELNLVWTLLAARKNVNPGAVVK